MSQLLVGVIAKTWHILIKSVALYVGVYFQVAFSRYIWTIFNFRCPIVEEDESAVHLFQPDQRADSNNGGCMVANIPSKEVWLQRDLTNNQLTNWPNKWNNVVLKPDLDLNILPILILKLILLIPLVKLLILIYDFKYHLKIICLKTVLAQCELCKSRCPFSVVRAEQAGHESFVWTHGATWHSRHQTDSGKSSSGDKKLLFKCYFFGFNLLIDNTFHVWITFWSKKV